MMGAVLEHRFESDYRGAYTLAVGYRWGLRGRGEGCVASIRVVSRIDACDLRLKTEPPIRYVFARRN